MTRSVILTPDFDPGEGSIIRFFASLRMTKGTYMNQQQNQQQGQNINIKIADETLKGVYANMMMVAHNQEEFVLDFLNMWQPQGIIVSRVVTSPGHLKRIAAALTENLKKYEEQFGEIKEVSKDSTENKSSTSGYKIGF